MESSFRWSNNKMRGNRWSRRTLTMVIFLFWQSRVNVASLWLDYWLWFCNGDEWACGLWWYTSASTYTGPPLFVADQLNPLTKPPINIDLTCFWDPIVTGVQGIYALVTIGYTEDVVVVSTTRTAHTHTTSQLILLVPCTFHFSSFMSLGLVDIRHCNFWFPDISQTWRRIILRSKRNEQQNISISTMFITTTSLLLLSASLSACFLTIITW